MPTSIFAFLLLVFTAQLDAQTFSADVNQPIPDDGSTVSFAIEVSGLPDSINPDFGLSQVCLNMTHTWDADMEVRIQSPGGTTFLLFAGIGGDGDNWENCCLRGDAADPIIQAGAPFSGIFKPMGSMGNVNNGQNPNGSWHIVLHDTYPFADAGFLQNWSLTFESPAPAPYVFPGSNLPLAIINTGGQSIPNEPKIEAAFQIIRHANGQLNFPTDTVFEYVGKIFVELQGFTGPGYPKKNYDFDLTDEQGAELDTSLLGMPAENDWILKAEYLDSTLMMNSIAYEFSRRMGRYAPRTAFCELFLDGEYQGVYTLTEKVKRDQNRMDIAKLTPQDLSGDSLTGGYIIEMNHNGAPGAWDSQFLPINFATNGLPVQFKYVYPKASEIMPEQADYIKTWVDSFEWSLHQPNFSDPENGYRKWIDEGTFLDFMLVNEMAVNFDSYGRSTFLYKEKITDGGKLKIGPPWDYDRGFCCIEGWVWEQTHPVWPFPDWWSILHTDDLFLQQRWCRWTELRQSAWTDAAFLTYIDSLRTLLKDAAPRNFQQWPELGYDDFDGQSANLKLLLAARLHWMDEHISQENCSVASAQPEPQAAGFHVYPNPTQDKLWVETGAGGGEVLLRILDAQGRLALRFEGVQSGLISLDVSGLAEGIYFLEVKREDVVMSEKFVLRR